MRQLIKFDKKRHQLIYTQPNLTQLDAAQLNLTQLSQSHYILHGSPYPTLPDPITLYLTLTLTIPITILTTLTQNSLQPLSTKPTGSTQLNCIKFNTTWLHLARHLFQLKGSQLRPPSSSPRPKIQRNYISWPANHYHTILTISAGPKNLYTLHCIGQN